MPTEQCVFLMYIHSIYGILYMYITKYGCVFLKLGESIYVAMDLIPIPLGSLPLAHNTQHSLVLYTIHPLAAPWPWVPLTMMRGRIKGAAGSIITLA